MKSYKLFWNFFDKNTSEKNTKSLNLFVESSDVASSVVKDFLKREENRGNLWFCYILFSARDLSVIARKERFIV